MGLYLHAFAYLLTPCIPGERTPFYPSIQTRVDYLLLGAESFSVAVPTDYVDLFDTQSPPSSHVTRLLVDVADLAVATLFDQVRAEAKAIADATSAPTRSTDKIVEILRDLRMVIPADGTAALTDLVNAGWILFHDADLWKDVPQIRPEERTRVLHDLILKSCEVAEFSERTRGA